MPTTAGSAPAPPDVPFLDILDPAFDFTSAEAAAAREANWYAESPIGLLVLRYAEAQELLRDRRLNHNGKRYMELNGIVDGPIHDWFVPMIVNHDGADHRRLRGLVNKAFTPRTVSNLRPFIRENAERLADNLASAEQPDFVEEFGSKLPLAVMCEMLGVLPEDYDTFRVWTTDLGRVFSLASEEDAPRRVAAAVIGMNDYIDVLLARKRAEPGGDLVSALVAAHRADGQVTEDELRNLLVTLVFAAHDTTRHQLANAMVTFSEHPSQWTLLAERPELATRAVEEVIRYHPSSSSVFRFAAEDFDYRGLSIAENTFLTMCTTLAQRDPRAFRNADTFDITAARNTPPLQFGGGPHHCLGAALARAELEEALPVLAGRLGPPTVAGPLSWRGPLGIHGPETLPLSFS